MERDFALFSKLLLYPEPGLRERVAVLGESIEPHCSAASRWLHSFVSALETLTEDAWEELYTRTFDITAQCPLYLGIHLFGPENHKRPVLMTNLCEVLSRNGVHTAVELPDHLAVVLANRTAFSDEEWDDFTELCLLPAIDAMVKDLERADNPYRFVLNALRHVLTARQGVAAHV